MTFGTTLVSPLPAYVLRSCTGTALLYRFDDNQSNEDGSSNNIMLWTALLLHSNVLIGTVLLLP